MLSSSWPYVPTSVICENTAETFLTQSGDIFQAILATTNKTHTKQWTVEQTILKSRSYNIVQKLFLARGTIFFFEKIT